MAVEENSLRGNRRLHKLLLYAIKVIPMVMAFCYLMNTIFSYCDIELVFLSYLASCSSLIFLYLYLASYVFKFCLYHRMFIHYLVLNTLINIYDEYIGIPLDKKEMFVLYISISGITLFIILYLYVRNNKKFVIKSSR